MGSTFTFTYTFVDGNHKARKLEPVVSFLAPDFADPPQNLCFSIQILKQLFFILCEKNLKGKHYSFY